MYNTEESIEHFMTMSKLKGQGKLLRFLWSKLYHITEMDSEKERYIYIYTDLMDINTT